MRKRKSAVWGVIFAGAIFLLSGCTTPVRKDLGLPAVQTDASTLAGSVNQPTIKRIAFLTALGTDDSFCKSYQEQNPRLAYCGPAKGFDNGLYDVIIREEIGLLVDGNATKTSITATPILLATSLAASAVGLRSVGQGLAAGVSSNPSSSWTTTTPTQNSAKKMFVYEITESIDNNNVVKHKYRCINTMDMVACRESWKALLLVQPQPTK